MTPSLDSWTIIFLLAAAQGIFFSTVIFFLKSRRVPSNYLIATLVFLFSLNLIEYVGFWTNYRYYVPHLNNVTEGFILLYGPLLYFYIKAEKDEAFRFSPEDLLHLIPFVLLLIYRAPYYLLSAEEKIDLMSGNLSLYDSLFEFYAAQAVIMLKLAHLGIYSWMSFSETRKINESAQRLKLNKINLAFSGFTIAFASYYLMVFTIGYDREFDYAISVAMSGFIYFIGYASYKDHTFLGSAGNGSKYQRSGLSASESVHISRKLIALMEEKQLYLKRDLKLQDLAGELGVPKYYISQILNEEIGKSYFEFINSYRIEEAKKLLRKKNQHLNMHGIAAESGFNNKTTFNQAFKKIAGCTPSEYRVNDPGA